MVFFRTYGELYGTAYAHHPTTAAATSDGRDSRVRDAWYGELMQQRSNEQRMNTGKPYVGKITGLTVCPGQLSGLIPVEDAKPVYPGADHNYPRTLDVFWPRLSHEQWLQLAATARPHAHHLATATSHDAMRRILAPGGRLLLTRAARRDTAPAWPQQAAEAGLIVEHVDERPHEPAMWHRLYRLWIAHSAQLRRDLGDVQAERMLHEAHRMLPRLPGRRAVLLTLRRPPGPPGPPVPADSMARPDRRPRDDATASSERISQ